MARAARAPDLDVSWLQASEIDKKSWSLSFGVRVPLLNGSRAEVARAEASASPARAVLERTRTEVSLASRPRYRRRRPRRIRCVFSRPPLFQTARRTWDLVRLSYEAGETSLLDPSWMRSGPCETPRSRAQAGFDLGKSVGRNRTNWWTVPGSGREAMMEMERCECWPS